MFGRYDDLQNGFGNNKWLVEELAIANILKITSNPLFEDVVDKEQLQVIKNYLKYYMKESTTSMANKMKVEEEQKIRELKK